ncbi:MAG: hypothetical protein HUJ51_04850 [Eggerthellaceae bacterium]|nr:hypothetical protein [Eggerthellaceae bacterium]
MALFLTIVFIVALIALAITLGSFIYTINKFNRLGIICFESLADIDDALQKRRGQLIKTRRCTKTMLSMSAKPDSRSSSCVTA